MPHTPGHNGYGGMGGRSTRSNRRRTRRNTSRPTRSNTASAAGRQRTNARNFQNTQRSTALQNRANQINQANTTSAVAGVPAGLNLPAGFNNRITKEKTDGSGGHDVFMCKGNTITSQGCIKINNKRNVGTNYIAKSGALGGKLGRR